MDSHFKVWLADDDSSIRWVLEQALRQAGMEPRGFEGAEEVTLALERDTPDVLITDIRMPGKNGLILMEEVRRQHPELPVIVMTAHSDLESTVAAYQSGAFEYLAKPFDIDYAVELVKRAAGQGGSTGKAAEQIDFPSMIGKAPAMQEVFRAIGRLSGSSMTVLITGESGTGKELIARALHRHSPRASGPFIALNTTAIASELLESELFGHERGAFTGANTMRRGRFEQADGGTLFLDEIGDMSPALQTRLLRVLAEGEFYRVGGQEPLKVDVRVLAATHQDLRRGVAEGRFREDLYHRLNVVTIHSPALRERREDIPLLLAHYLDAAARELAVAPKRLGKEAEQRLLASDWPGNVRQLVNVCRRLTALAPGQEISPGDLPGELGGSADTATAQFAWAVSLADWAQQHLLAENTPLLKQALPQFERTLIEVALREVKGRRQDAAKLLGWGRNTLTRKIKELGIKD